MHPLAQLFPAEDHRFHLTLRRGDPGDFFRNKDASGELLKERVHWLNTGAFRYHALLPAGQLLLAEVTALAQAWGTPVRTGDDCRALGAAWEPDFLLMARDEQGALRLVGGALCFPSGWALEEKLGHDLSFIHGPVPGLNPMLGSPIDRFLDGLKPGIAFLRDNWGIAATDELNLHPARGLPGPMPPVDLTRLWLRVEHQALVALPDSCGVLFGIRISLHRLDHLAKTTALRSGLARALRSMPEALAAYKRLEHIRPDLIMALCE